MNTFIIGNIINKLTGNKLDLNGKHGLYLLVALCAIITIRGVM